jgi:hypothetical protein
MDDIVEIARVMRPRSCAKTLAGTCKEMLGTAQSVGCTVDHEHPQKIMEKVRGGVSAVGVWLQTKHSVVGGGAGGADGGGGGGGDDRQGPPTRLLLLELGGGLQQGGVWAQDGACSRLFNGRLAEPVWEHRGEREAAG